ncbi:MAG: hypothetical protein ACRC46_02040 [Thermoguttaceae bacterium]
MKRTFFLVLAAMVIFAANFVRADATSDLVASLKSARADAQAAYEKSIRENTSRRDEHENRSLTHGDKSMKFHFEKKGDAPKDGFPLFIALHGGGGAPAPVNDQQYDQMKMYYLGNVDCGVYVATRGVTNTSNLHSVDESYPLYERLIENMVVFEGVDPNRVYVLGFSAGGDGTYQIGTRMADKFAAAAMSAGHPNGVSAVNLYHLPFLLQVGEADAAYNRNRETVGFYEQIQKWRDEYKGGYVADCFVHQGRGHNFLDNAPNETPQKVYSNPQGWLDGSDKSTHKVNTSSIAWLKQHQRNLCPDRVVWDLSTRAPSRGDAADYFYYLHKVPETRGDLVVVKLQAADHKIIVEKLDGEIEVLLNETMLDLTKPIQVEFADGVTTTVSAETLKPATNFYSTPQHLPFLTSIRIVPESHAVR